MMVVDSILYCIVNSLGLRGTDKAPLDRRVPTRWNLDSACLKAHFYLKDAIQILTNGGLAENLIPLHELFDNLIHRFSQAEAPMICEVISRLERLERSMTRVAMLPGSLASFPLKGKRCFDEWKVLCTL
ncbi:hypothetical protein BKA83DRAFT_2889421 [Pisolithus microcarpus]|nr:hypothetical protein BKA83DRAFT_2889421 [Pisolithus microcarpus]